MNDNKLIAEFMGYRLFGTKCRKPNLMYNLNDDLAPMQFHTSWDWLMPVVQKVYQLGLDNEGALLVRDAVAEANLDGTYDAVVEFINEHDVQLEKDIKNELYE